jgi:hypothetical protein
MEKINITIDFNINRVPKIGLWKYTFCIFKIFPILVKYSINRILFHNIKKNSFISHAL